MKRKFLFLPLILLLVVSCSGLNVNWNLNNKTPYDQAVSFFADAWESYHKVWLQLPEEKKAEWVETYHTKFQMTGEFLQVWASNPNDPIQSTLWDTLKDELELILIKTAMEGGK